MLLHGFWMRLQMYIFRSQIHNPGNIKLSAENERVMHEWPSVSYICRAKGFVYEINRRTTLARPDSGYHSRY